MAMKKYVKIRVCVDEDNFHLKRLCSEIFVIKISKINIQTFIIPY